jgi:hypothetical protein
MQNNQLDAGERIVPAAMRPDVASAYTGLSVQRLAKFRLFGGGPEFVKAGRSILYRRSDLDAWLNANRRRSTSDGGTVAEGA